jgi:hypothetical protein
MPRLIHHDHLKKRAEEEPLGRYTIAGHLIDECEKIKAIAYHEALKMLFLVPRQKGFNIRKRTWQ